MPVFPTYDSKRNFEANTQGPVMTGRENSLNALEKAGKVLTTEAENWSNAHDVMQLTEKKAKHGVALAELQLKAEADPNFKNSKMYGNAINELNKNAVEGIDNKLVAQKAALEFQGDSQLAALKIEANFKKKELLYNKEMVNVDIRNLEQQRLDTKPGSAERANIELKIDETISNQVSSGTFSELEAIEARNTARKDSAEMAIMADPDAAIAELKDDQGYYKDMDRKERISLITTASEYKKKLKVQADEAVKEMQFQTQTDFAMKIAGGDIVTVQEIGEMVRSGRMSGDFGEMAIKAITSPNSVKKIKDSKHFQILTEEIFRAGTREEQSAAILKIMKGGGDGQLSKDDMAILVSSALKWAGKNDHNLAIQSLGKWADESKLPKEAVYKQFQAELNAGKPVAQAADLAMVNTIINTIPGVSINEDVPNMVVTKDSPIRFIFPKETKVYPNRLYNPSTGKLEQNPEVNPKAKAK